MSESRLQAVRRIEFTVDWPPGHVACYLVDAAEPVLVDAGMPADYATAEASPDRTFREGVAAAGYDVADIEHLVVTHPHVDHVGQVPTVLEEADATVYAPAGLDERFGRDPDALADRVRENAHAAGITGDELDGAVEMAVESFERDRRLLPREAVDVWLADGDTVEIGDWSAEVIHAPGHQADHVCLRTELDGETVLLSGDMAIEPFRAVAIHDGLDDGVYESFEAFYDAIDRLAEYDVDRVYPGHGPVHTDYEAVLDRDRRALDRQLDRVHEQLEEGCRTVPGIAMALAGDRSLHYLVPETVGALAHLERQGRATVTETDGVNYYEPT